MDDTWFIPLWAQLVILVGFVALFIAGAVFAVRQMGRIFSGTGGWSKLASVYATQLPMPAETLRGQSVEVGSVIYKRCVDVAVTDAGLQLQLTGIAALSPSPSLLIPWRAFGRAEPARLFWEDARTLTVGAPTVATLTVRQPIFDAMRERLPAAS